jgi:hypothetical protein
MTATTLGCIGPVLLPKRGPSVSRGAAIARKLWAQDLKLHADSVRSPAAMAGDRDARAGDTPIGERHTRVEHPWPTSTQRASLGLSDGDAGVTTGINAAVLKV